MNITNKTTKVATATCRFNRQPTANKYDQTAKRKIKCTKKELS